MTDVEALRAELIRLQRYVLDGVVDFAVVRTAPGKFAFIPPVERLEQVREELARRA